jgi:hypothetical protein
MSSAASSSPPAAADADEDGAQLPEATAVAPSPTLLDSIWDSIVTPGAGPGLIASINGSLLLLMGVLAYLALTGEWPSEHLIVMLLLATGLLLSVNWCVTGRGHRWKRWKRMLEGEDGGYVLISLSHTLVRSPCPCPCPSLISGSWPWPRRRPRRRSCSRWPKPQASARRRKMAVMMVVLPPPPPLSLPLCLCAAARPLPIPAPAPPSETAVRGKKGAMGRAAHGEGQTGRTRLLPLLLLQTASASECER